MKRSVMLILALCLVAASFAPLAASEPILTTGTASAWGVSRPIRDLIRELPQPTPGLAVEIPVGARPGTFDRQDPGTQPSG
ncbi:MAG: hypothetical protein R3190_16265, partial [Thermoanaerobaculia bacterium]|nr:hypothetical protein [Thermoanaerobaculia bacterium]